MKKIFLILGLLVFTTYAMELQTACSKGDFKKVKELLAKDSGALNLSLNAEGFNIMHYAAGSTCPEVIELILNAKPELIDVQDKVGNIPFIHFCFDVLNWRQDYEETKKHVHFGLRMGFLSYTGPSLEDKEAAKVIAYRKIINLFVSRGANLDISNARGNRWTDIPGLEFHFVEYTREQLQKRSAAAAPKP